MRIPTGPIELSTAMACRMMLRLEGGSRLEGSLYLFKVGGHLQINLLQYIIQSAAIDPDMSI